MDFESYFLDKYKEMDRYYNYLDGPRFPLSVATKVLKLLGAVSSRFKYLTVKNSLKKFMPFDTSIGTAGPFESTPPPALSDALEGWRGWLLCESCIILHSG